MSKPRWPHHIKRELHATAEITAILEEIMDGGYSMPAKRALLHAIQMTEVVGRDKQTIIREALELP